MLTRSYLITAVSVFLLLSCASDVRGDPISFLYRVDVTSRFGRLTVPFEPTSFDLVATLDDRVTHSFVEPPTVRQVYGTVSFSPIPLPVPNMYPGLSPPEPSSSGAAIEYTRIDFARIPEYEIYGALGSTIGQRTLNGYCCAYEQSATLAGYAKVFTKPVLSARSLARLVGSQGGFDFDIYKNDLAGLDPLEFVSYHGTVTFLQEINAAEPVAEPGALLLLATGGGALVARARRCRNVER